MPSRTSVARRLAAVAALASLAVACAGDRATAPGTGTLDFQLDRATCSHADTAEIFIDGTSRGRYLLSPDQQQGFVVAAGQHSAAASLRGTYVMSIKPLDVLPRGAAVFTVGCFSPAAVEGSAR